ncbi:MAG: methionyl-tRNA formyltransferase [Armatimonadota bacterium]
MRIAFMGTPDFAATILKALIESSHQVAGVVTQPDRPKGRGRRAEASPVSRLGDENGIPVVKPSSKKDPEFALTVKAWMPQLTVVAAYGVILTPDLLAIAPGGNINVHASLLPKYRGAAPVQDAIIKGESITGVTTMMMDAGLDTGDILLQKETPIPVSMTAGELEERLAAIGTQTLLETLARLDAKDLHARPQDPALATYAGSLRPHEGYILWNQRAFDTHNRIRGCTPRPGARCFFRGQSVRIWKSEIADCSKESCAGRQPGEIIGISSSGICVACNENTAICLSEVQPANKVRMSATDYVRGLRVTAGDGSHFDRNAPE